MISAAVSLAGSLLLFGFAVLLWLCSDINGSLLFQWPPADDRTSNNEHFHGFLSLAAGFRSYYASHIGLAVVRQVTHHTS